MANKMAERKEDKKAESLVPSLVGKKVLPWVQWSVWPKVDNLADWKAVLMVYQRVLKKAAD